MNIHEILAKPAVLKSTGINKLVPASVTMAGQYSTRAGRRKLARMITKAQRKGAKP